MIAICPLLVDIRGLAHLRGMALYPRMISDRRQCRAHEALIIVDGRSSQPIDSQDTGVGHSPQMIPYLSVPLPPVPCPTPDGHRLFTIRPLLRRRKQTEVGHRPLTTSRVAFQEIIMFPSSKAIACQQQKASWERLKQGVDHPLQNRLAQNQLPIKMT